MCHVTGGGLPGNLPRVLPDGLGVQLRPDLPRPPIFDCIAARGPVEWEEMRRAFNLGVGFVFVVAAADSEGLCASLAAAGEEPIPMGDVVTVSADTPFEDRVRY
jgi:phosphoribosylformylglycinamidine cyclo-ligase